MALKKNLSDLAREARERGVAEVDVDELARMMAGGDTGGEPEAGGGALVIDIREADERRRGFIPGSVAIPRGVLERDVEKRALGGTASDADLARPIVCYCGGGSRSLLACDALRQMGFTDVHSLEGGFRAWGDSGRPVDIDRRASPSG